MSCGEENRKSPAAGSGRAFGRGLGCEGSLGELGLELGNALVGIDGKAGLLLQNHGSHEGILSMGHDEGHLHLAAAGLLRKQLGLRVVGTDECIAGILVQLLGLLKVTLASSIERCKQIGLGVTCVCDNLESNHRDFFFGCHVAFLSHMNQWRAAHPGIRAALCMSETITFKQKRTAQNVISSYERSFFARERFLNQSEQYRTQLAETQTDPRSSANRAPYRPRRARPETACAPHRVQRPRRRQSCRPPTCRRACCQSAP